MTVYRNDEIALDDLIAIKPTQLVVSPGPGERSPALGLILAAHQFHDQGIQIQTLASAKMQFDTFRAKYQCWGFVWENRSSILSLVGK